MPSKNQRSLIKQEGRNFASMLFDLPLKELQNPSEADFKKWQEEYPHLEKTTIDNIICQTQEARTHQQERVGWQAIPHDLTVIIFVLGTIVFGLKIGIIVGIASLVFFESLFQFVFIQKYYRPLSLIVWLTYPAYIILGYYLYQQNYPWYWIAVAILGAWFGTFFLGNLARIPMKLIMQAKKEAQVKKSQQAK